MKSLCESVQGCPELMHYLFMGLRTHFNSPTWIFMHVEGIYNAKWEFVWLELSGEATVLFN